MTRVVIHAGFHKTGTTSVQNAIAANRALLEPHLRCLLKPDLAALAAAARAFSARPGPALLADVFTEAEAFLATLEPGDPRPVLISCEDLSGHLPGRRGLDRYDAAPLVMGQLALAAQARFGDGLDLVFCFSTRGREAWLRSTWWQNLRSTRLRLDLADYRRHIAAAADLPAVVAEVAEMVAPARVVAVPLEESTVMAQGPLTPLLDLAGLPDAARDALVVPPPVNVLPVEGLPDVFLALNRSGFDARTLSAAKRQLRRLAEAQDADRLHQDRAPD